MKICVSAISESIDGKVDQRFGRCAYFILVDADAMKYEVVANNAANATSGAGIQAVQSVADNGVDVILTGNIGPNAYRVLSSAGTQIFMGVTGTDRKRVARFKNRKSIARSTPTVSGHRVLGGRHQRRRMVEFV
jgi:predicted Fe-Mo cluster-binding NifX family protein